MALCMRISDANLLNLVLDFRNQSHVISLFSKCPYMLIHLTDSEYSFSSMKGCTLQTGDFTTLYLFLKSQIPTWKHIWSQYLQRHLESHHSTSQLPCVGSQLALVSLVWRNIIPAPVMLRVLLPWWSKPFPVPTFSVGSYHGRLRSTEPWFDTTVKNSIP